MVFTVFYFYKRDLWLMCFLCLISLLFGRYSVLHIWLD